jgi:hypothetical protein
LIRQLSCPINLLKHRQAALTSLFKFISRQRSHFGSQRKEVETSRQQNQIMLTTLQNQMAQHQQAMELQMKQFELQLRQYNDKK